MASRASHGEIYCSRSALERLRYHVACGFRELTLHFRVISIVQFGQHDFEGLDRFVIPLGAMKRCMLQIISKVRRRAELGDLCDVRMSLC